MQEKRKGDKEVSDAWFDAQVRKHNAVKWALGKPGSPPDKAIWYETINFGYILSAVDPKTGKRKILVKH